jgi:hypothetical protein
MSWQYSDRARCLVALWNFARCVSLRLDVDIMFWRWRWSSIGQCLENLVKVGNVGFFLYAIMSCWCALMGGLAVPYGWSRVVAVCEGSLGVVRSSGRGCDVRLFVKWCG